MTATTSTVNKTEGGNRNSTRHRMHELVLNQKERVFWYSAFASLNEDGSIHSLNFDPVSHESRENAFKRVQGTDTGVVAQVTLFSGKNPAQGPPQS